MKFAAATLVASGIVSGSEVTGGTCAVSWTDCGDSSTHGKITDLQPTSFSIGDDVTLTGTGTLDKEIDGGKFKLHISADGLFTRDWTGDICEAKTFSLPLGLGSVSWGGVDCPVASGSLSVPIGVKFSSYVPASLANGKVEASATTNTGDKLVCVSASLSKQEALEVTGGTCAVSWTDCGDSSTHGKITDLQPTSFSIGDDVTLTGTGTLDKEIDGGKFKLHINADGLFTRDWTGDICEAKTFSLPLGLGSVSWGGVDCPVASGSLSVPIGVKFSSYVPAALANGKVEASATTTSGDKLVCVSATLSKQTALV